MLHLVDTKKGNANTTSLVNMNLIKGIPFESMCSFAKNTKIHKQRFITRSTSLPSFARNISLSFHSTFSYVSQTTINGDGDSINDKGLFLLQTVNINRNNFTIFYDNGCSDFIVKQSAITLLGKNARWCR